MINFIVCSPKNEKSNSKYIAEDIIKNINDKYIISYLYKDSIKTVFNNIIKSEKIIFIFPLYVDSLPSKLIEYFENIEFIKMLKDKLIYSICQCGFLESYQNYSATLIFKCFCLENRLNYMGCLNIGAGECLGNSLLKKIKILSYDYYDKIKNFSESVCNNKKCVLDTKIKLVSKKMYIFFANNHWKKCIKNN